LGAALVGAYMAAQVVALVFYVIGGMVLHGGKPVSSVEALTTNGTVFSLSVILGGPVTICLCGLFAWLRKGPALPSYLGLCWPKPRAVIWWSLGLLLLWAGSDAVTIALDRPVIPEIMAEIYWSTAFPPLIWIALIIAGPATEEFIFRGFLFRGWQESRLGGWGTIILTSLLWAVIHLQYDLYGIASIFIVGIFLGAVRLKTGSVPFCAFLHSVINLIATIQIELFTAAA
jgi:membrane protease YdiL (CAAX protease family)